MELQNGAAIFWESQLAYLWSGFPLLNWCAYLWSGISCRWSLALLYGDK